MLLQLRTTVVVGLVVAVSWRWFGLVLAIPSYSSSLLLQLHFSSLLPFPGNQNIRNKQTNIISLYGFYIVFSGYISDYYFFLPRQGCYNRSSKRDGPMNHKEEVRSPAFP